MVSQVATDPEFHLAISGIGGISTWKDALEFILLGAQCSGLYRCYASRFPHRSGYD